MQRYLSKLCLPIRDSVNMCNSHIDTILNSLLYFSDVWSLVFMDFSKKKKWLVDIHVREYINMDITCVFVYV